MQNRRMAIALLTVACLSACVAREVTPTLYEKAYIQLMDLKPVPAQGAPVKNIVITRDAGEFALEEGQLFLCTQVLDRTVAAVFYGKGTFSFTPPLQVERDQLNRFYERDSLHEPFTFLVILFGDSTLRELYHKCKFGPLPQPSKQWKIQDCLAYMGDKDSKAFDPEIMKTFLELRSNELFYAFIDTKDRGDLFFEINPFAEEEVRLMQKADVPRVFGMYREAVSSFHLQKCYASGDLDHRAGREFIKTEKYAIRSVIDDDVNCAIAADITFLSLKEDQSWIYFNLFGELKIDSVLDADGRSIPYVKGKEDSRLWLNFDPPLSTGQKRTVRVVYHGGVLGKNTDLAWVVLRSPDLWYPRYDWKNKQMYDLTFLVPSRMKFSCVGSKVSSTVQNDVEESHWVTSKPIRNASFNVGYFKEFKIEGDSLPPVLVQMSDYAHRELGGDWNMEEDVGADVKESLHFYQHIFGKCSADELCATEIPQAHGEAFDGLIHLSYWTFQSRDESGDHEIFRAHEVAHQWWGIGVGFKTYHDQWLSEAFSEYSALWYMQERLHNNDKFFDQLKKWKDAIFSNRKFLFGSGQEAGPVWLGYRTQSTKTSGDYDLIVYKKGAWALHMLRMILIDLKTMNEDRFQNIMRKFYSTYAGSSASTTDFQRAVEAEMGIDMGWFFRQWIYDTHIPKYKFSYRVAEQPGDKFKVTCTVDQSNVPDDFQMPVPLYVDFGDKRFARVRVIVKGPHTQVDLPLMPLKPEKIVFNDMESVLCDIDDTGEEKNK